MKSPFVFGKVAAGDKFTDREDEQKKLSNNIASNINTVLISPRRWGKSSLVAKVGEVLQHEDKTFRFCFIDLFNVRTEQEFYTHFAREVLRVSFSKRQERLESAKKLFKQIKPKFTVGADPNADYSILFQREVDGLTNPQINFLKALCDEVQQLSAAETLQRYRLGTSGNVNRIKAALVNKEIIDIASDRIEFIDPLFKLWFSKIYMK